MGDSRKRGQVSRLLLAVTGCAVIPAEGPISHEIRPDQDSHKSKNYFFADLNHENVQVLKRFQRQGLGAKFSGKGRAVWPRIGVGDELSITIWEAGEGRSLLATKESKRTDLPPISVGKSGYITIPYAGRIRVSGRTAEAVQKSIVVALSEKAVLPQAMVNITKNESRTVIINGDVARPGRYPLTAKGSRILDIVAAAGGSKFPARETFVTFVRHSKNGEQLMKAIVENPRENIFLRPDDQIFLTRDPRTYMAFGAVVKTNEYKFEADEINLLEAVARTGGLNDVRSGATGVYLFRYERGEAVQALQPDYNAPPHVKVPVIYSVNMRDPNAYFFAQNFDVRDKDVIYVSNATGVELQKFMDLLTSGSRIYGNMKRALTN